MRKEERTATPIIEGLDPREEGAGETKETWVRNVC